ncbi:MAG: 16S rRNA (uracil(1498)-N(3))-methyltransferase [Ignavibacteriae bacterium]|nr:MAG: 16S rRNA (uracil(1498)-N(3))-methyltransferase [Ignavibacteriota bacterium]
MDYFYVSLEDVTSHELVLRGDESKHLIRVLRKNVGDRIFVTDGNEMMYQAVIAATGKSETRCTIVAMHRKYNEPFIEMTLAVSLLKNPARFDYIVEKTTELGVRTIQPISSERTIAHGVKRDRLEKIALSAMKQCGRSWLPRIQPMQNLKPLIESTAHYQLKLILHEKAGSSQTIASELLLHDDLHSVIIMVGPEGGFSEEETAYATHAGFKSISLGTRRLRTETAAVVAVSQVLL